MPSPVVAAMAMEGNPAAALISAASALYGMQQTKETTGAATGSTATMAAPARPAHISTVTRTPAAALVIGEKGLSVPNASRVSGAVAASAARPVAIAAESGGGSQRLRVNSRAGPRSAMPETARYESLNDRVCALSGQMATEAQNVSARMVNGGWGRSAAATALAMRKASTARETDGEAPARNRKAEASAHATPRARNGPSANPRSNVTSEARMLTFWPDRARIWAHPDLVKSSASLPSISSRTPMMRASRSGPASPPARDNAPSRERRALARNNSSRGGGRSRVMSAALTKAVRGARASVQAPAPVRGASVPRLMATRTDWPRTGSGAPLDDSALVTRPVLPVGAGRQYTLRRPLAVMRAPSEASAAVSSRSYPVMPLAVFRGSETIRPSYPSTRTPVDSAKPEVKPADTASVRPCETMPKQRPAARAKTRKARRLSARSEDPVVDFNLELII